MDLEIYWTEFAQKELQKIFIYHKELVSLSIATKIVEGIYNSTLVLKNQVEIGQVEELLLSRPQNFRYLVYTNYKIIYWLNRDRNWIEITDVFDTRQNPVKIKRTK